MMHLPHKSLGDVMISEKDRVLLINPSHTVLTIYSGLPGDFGPSDPGFFNMKELAKEVENRYFREVLLSHSLLSEAIGDALKQASGPVKLGVGDNLLCLTYDNVKVFVAGVRVEVEEEPEPQNAAGGV
jgi:hypothetical protein